MLVSYSIVDETLDVSEYSETSTRTSDIEDGIIENFGLTVFLTSNLNERNRIVENVGLGIESR